MKKLTPLFVLILFSVFLLIGYKIAARVFPLRKPAIPEINPSPSEPGVQSNFLLFQVNDLEAKEPQVIAIWAGLHSISSTDEFFFISLYPTVNLVTNQQVKSIFSLTRGDLLTASSYRRFKNLFDISLDGYFIIDNSGLLDFASKVGVDQLELINDSPETVESAILVEKSGKVFLNSICDLLESGAGNSFFSKIDWATLTQAHLSSSISPTEIQNLIDGTILADKTISCRVIIPE